MNNTLSKLQIGLTAYYEGDSLDWEYEDEMEAQALEEMDRIEKLLGTPPE